MNSIIQKLKNEGNLRLYLDFRSGDCTDRSGNGYNGTPSSGCTFGRDGIYFNTVDYVTVADAVPLRLTTGTIVCLGKFAIQADNLVIYDKRNAGGTNVNVFITTVGVLTWNGATTSTCGCSTKQSKCISLGFVSGTKPLAYVNGVYVAEGGLSQTYTADDADITIGKYYTGTYPFQNWMSAILLIARVLTATEHALLFYELENTKFERSI